MKADESVKYYDGLLVSDTHEISAEQARTLRNYSRAFFISKAHGTQLDRVERYSSGELTRVDYHDERNSDEVKAHHSKMYKGVEFTTRRELHAIHDFIWREVHAYSKSGDPEGSSLILQHKDGREVMEITVGNDRKVLGTTKYHWVDQEDLQYIFEYDRDGRLDSVYDLLYSDRTSLEDLKDVLSDVRFFERGEHLPKEISHTGIPL